MPRPFLKGPKVVRQNVPLLVQIARSVDGRPIRTTSKQGLNVGEEEYCTVQPSAHGRFLSLRQAIFVFSLKNLLCAAT